MMDGSGKVIAEKKNEDMESFLGLHYPESDIPKQARGLYLKKEKESSVTYMLILFLFSVKKKKILTSRSLHPEQCLLCMRNILKTQG